MKRIGFIVALVGALLLHCSYACAAEPTVSSPSAATPNAAAATGSDSDAIHPFTFRVPDAALEELRTKLSLTRLPIQDDLDEDSWERGINMRYLKGLLHHWQNEYDWRAREREMNELQHFTTVVDGQTLHFIHARSPRPGAVPLLFAHGWPGSFLECVKLLPLWTRPENASLPAFHVVCPSIPGYGFSAPAPSGRHMNVQDAAALFVSLMARLGYGRYIAQGGDWGSVVVAHMASIDPTHCRGVHLNAAPVAPPFALFATRNWAYALWRSFNTLLDFILPLRWRFPAEEARLLEVKPFEAWAYEQTGYFHQQSTFPDTLGVGLEDSPAGLAAWLVEKFRAWSDCCAGGGLTGIQDTARAHLYAAARSFGSDAAIGPNVCDVERVFSKTELLDHVSLYYFTRSITSSMRLYYETTHPRQDIKGGKGKGGPSSPLAFLQALSSWDVQVPTGFAIFPGEILYAPRKWLEDYFPRLRHYVIQERGGHFAAMEVPHLLARDVQNFVAEHVLPSNWDEQAPAATHAETVTEAKSEL